MNTKTETETMSEAIPLTAEAAMVTANQPKYAVIVDKFDGEARIVSVGGLASYAPTGYLGYSSKPFVEPGWVITARSNDLDQLRALCRLVGQEFLSIHSAHFLYQYLPSKA